MAARLIAIGLAVAAAAASGGCGEDDQDTGDTPSASTSDRIRAQDAAAFLRRELAPTVGVVRVTVEPSCPPPAVLACRPALRLAARAHKSRSARLRRDLAAAVPPTLRALGFRRVEVSQRYRRGELHGRATSDGERLARWRTRDGELELVTGGPGL